ncbi:relaxase MobL [Caniella muris]|uniref:relaxase MobL n=1 Tax=Caniella muris TaxID=2941502 RepID=UPI00203AD508|nr:relaxase MobL [Caniella muris]
MPDDPCVVSASFTVPSPRGGSRGASPGAHAARYVGRDGACESLGATAAPLLAPDPPRMPLTSVPGGRRVADGRLFGSMEGIGSTLSGTGSWAEAACRRIQDLFLAGRTVVTLVFSFARYFMESVGAVAKGALALGRAQVLRVRAAVARAMERVGEEYDSMGWVAGVHTNTDHVHCHVSVVEQGRSPRTSKGKVPRRCLAEARRRAAEALEDGSCGRPWAAVAAADERSQASVLDGLEAPVVAAGKSARDAVARTRGQVASALEAMAPEEVRDLAADGQGGTFEPPWPVLGRPMAKRSAAEERSCRARALSERAAARLQVESVRPSDTAGLQAAWLASLAEAAAELSERELERSRRRRAVAGRDPEQGPEDAPEDPRRHAPGNAPDALAEALQDLADAAIAPELISEAVALGIVEGPRMAPAPEDPLQDRQPAVGATAAKGRQTPAAPPHRRPGPEADGSVPKAAEKARRDADAEAPEAPRDPWGHGI